MSVNPYQSYGYQNSPQKKNNNYLRTALFTTSVAGVSGAVVGYQNTPKSPLEKISFADVKDVFFKVNNELYPKPSIGTTVKEWNTKLIEHSNDQLKNLNVSQNTKTKDVLNKIVEKVREGQKPFSKINKFVESKILGGNSSTELKALEMQRDNIIDLTNKNKNKAAMKFGLIAAAGMAVFAYLVRPKSKQ